MPAETGAIGKAHISGVVLAGGRGARMGGVDKGLQLHAGEPLALRALRRLQPQVGSLMLSANRHLETYRGFGAPVWTDTLPGYAGPLAGIAAALEHCTTEYLATVPCDAPFFPDDLVVRLAEALASGPYELAMACTPEPDNAAVPRAQPAFCLLATGLRVDLLRFTEAGGRKVEEWTRRHATVRVRFEDARAFLNLNTQPELRDAEPGSTGAASAP